MGAREGKLKLHFKEYWQNYRGERMEAGRHTASLHSFQLQHFIYVWQEVHTHVLGKSSPIGKLLHQCRQDRDT